MRVALGLNTCALINCADNTGAKNIYIVGVYGIRGHLNRLPKCSVGDMVLCSVKKGKPELRKKGKHPSLKPFLKSPFLLKSCKPSLSDRENLGEEMMGSSCTVKVTVNRDF